MIPVVKSACSFCLKYKYKFKNIFKINKRFFDCTFSNYTNCTSTQYAGCCGTCSTLHVCVCTRIHIYVVCMSNVPVQI